VVVIVLAGQQDLTPRCQRSVWLPEHLALACLLGYEQPA
jgi:hypothetical protein